MTHRKPAAFAALTLALLGSVSIASAQSGYRPLTVGRHHVAPDAVDVSPAYQYNPYAGPGAIVTAPIGAARTLVGLPFQAINAIFPAQGNTPLVLIGAPVAFAGRLAQFPFRVAEAPFGGPNPFQY